MFALLNIRIDNISMIKLNEERFSYFIIILLFIIHCLSIQCDIFNGDSALYASISKNIAISNDFIYLNSIMSENWIDKPHFIFWIWAISIKIFGNTVFAFKLPGLCALSVLLYYTYLFTKSNYGKYIGLSAVVILGSSLHIFISINDTRLDIFYVAFVMAAIYYFNRYINLDKYKYFFFASIFTSLAIMTKGIFVLLPIGFAIFTELILTKKIHRIFDIRWFLFVIILFIALIPELYCLHLQFIQNHGIPILGQKASNAIQFFFWDSQFGRFQSNLGQLQMNGDKSFFFHTILWAFAPWTFMLFRIIYFKLGELKEYYCLGAFLIMLFILSFSRTQLSHHVLILLPFMSIVLALMIHTIRPTKTISILDKLHYFILCLLPLVTFIFLQYFTEKFQILFILISFICIALAMLIIKIQPIHIPRIILLTAIAGIYIGLVLNLIIYPNILRYQAGHQAADYIKNTNKTAKVVEIYTNPSLLNYHAEKNIQKGDIQDIHDSIYHSTIYCGPFVLDYLNSNRIKHDTFAEFNEFRTTVLTPEFINKKTRDKVLNKQFFIAIRK